jgi:hypothetical protein
MIEGWLRMPFHMPELEDQDRLVEAVIDEGNGKRALITGRLDFLEWIEDEEDPESGFRLPLFNIIVDGECAYSFHEVYEWRFVNVGTVQ